jgi:predicted dehydrogenase
LPIDHQQFNLEKGDALLGETRAFVESVRDGKPILVSGRDGLKALALAEAVIKDAFKRIS